MRFMNRIKLITGLLLCWLAAQHVHAQLRVQVQVARPYPNKITDFQSNPNQVVVLINNTSNAAYRIQLIGAVTGDNNVSVRTSGNYRSSHAIEVAPLSVTRVSAEDVGELFNPNSLVFSGVTREQAIRLNGLPEGLYQICARAIDFTTRAPLSDEEPLGCSNLFTVSNLEPPVIIKPFAEEEIRATLPQNLVFSWSMPPGAPPTTQYIVRIAEMIDPNRNAFDILRSSRQLFYETTIIGAPTMLYGPAEPPLVAGRKYAMMITAVDPFSNLVFRNGGRSEVVAFTYGVAPKGTSSGVNDGKDIIPSLINIPRNTIAGKIKWSFKATEEKEGIQLGTSVSLAGIENKYVVEAMLDPTVGPAMNSIVQSSLNGTKVTNASITTAVAAMNKKPETSIATSAHTAISGTQAPGVVVSGGGKVTAVTAPQLGPAMVGSEHYASPSSLGNDTYPLQRTLVKIYAVKKNGSQSFLSSATTDDEGNFAASYISTAFYNPTLGDQLKVTINHPDFILEKTITTLPAADSTGRKDLGTLTAGARSFRFKPTVIDDEGNAVTDAVIEIYRAINYYNQNPNHKHEGATYLRSSATTIVNGTPCVKIGQVRSGKTMARLFYSDDWMDEYQIKVVHPRLNTLKTSLKVAAGGSAREEIITIEKEFKTTVRMPSLKGNVSKKLQPIIPVAGAIVTLHINKDAEPGPTPLIGVEYIGSQFLQGATVNGAANSAIQSVTGGTNNNSILKNTVTPTTSPSANKPAGTSSNNGPAVLNGNSNIYAAVQAPTGTIASSFVGSLATSVSAAKLLGETRSATADSAGNYTFTNLPISATITKISVRIPGSTEVFYDSVMIDTKGVDIIKDIQLSMTVFTLGGIIKNEETQAIPYPVLRWASGGSTFEGDAQGRFIATNTAGKDTLIVTKMGYEVKRVPVTLNAPSKNDSKKKGNIAIVNSPQQWGQSVQGLNSYNSVPQGTPAFTAVGLGFQAQTNVSLNAIPTNTISSSGNKNNTTPSGIKPIGNNASMVMQSSFELGPLYNSLITPDQQPAPAIDLGTIILRKRIGRLLVKVTGGNETTALSNATITVMDTPKTGKTDAKGYFFTEVPGGEIQVQIKGPDGAEWVTVQKQVETSDIDTTRLNVTLKSGVRVNGTVRAASQPVADARIRVDGLDYIDALSNAEGKYSLVIPQGEYTLKVTKTEYIGGQKQQTFTGTQATVDLELSQAGFDISKILGFEVEVESMTGSGNSRTLSGAFVHLPSNPLFSIKPDTRLPFDNLNVDLVNNIPVPKNGLVTLSVTSLEAKGFEYLPVLIKNNDQALTIKQAGGNNQAGVLSGIPEINYKKFIPIPLGYVLPDNARHILSFNNGTPELPILQTGDALATVESMSLSSTSAASAEVYGFTVTLDLPNCKVLKDGLSLKGELSLAGVPLMNNVKMNIKELVIGKDGGISKASIDVPVNQSLNMAGWGLELQTLNINENGLKLSGNIKIKIPSSAQSTIGFSNLALSKTALYGGEFTLPDQGIDVFNIIKMKRGPVPLSFGRVGNSSVYYVGGSGKFNLPKLIDKTLIVDFFQIQTDGKFAATVQANLNASLFGLADLTIHSIGFRTINGVGIDLKGDFNLNAIPFFKATAGGIHYESNGSVSLEELGLAFDLVGVAKLDARVRFVDTPERKGFEGEGNIGINSTPFQLGMGFKYYKLPAGIEVGAKLKVGITIPVGAITLSELEGEFNLNTQEKSWMARLSASASIGGLNAVIAIKPLAITVRNGPIFQIDAGLAVLDQKIASAKGLLDFPKSYFGLTFEQKMDFLPKLFTVNSTGAFIISTAQNDTYWMMGVHTDASMLGGLVKGNANITAGWGLSVSAHPELSDYTNFIDPAYLDNGKLKGVHVATFAGINFDSGNVGIAGVATGRIYYKNFSDVSINMGFGSGRYGFRVAAGWEAGGDIRIMDHSIAGLEIGMTGEVKGFYDYNTSYISLEGGLNAKLVAWFGGCTSSCATKICWGGCFNACIFGCELCPIPVGGKICVHPGVHAAYNSDNGFSLSVDL